MAHDRRLCYTQGMFELIPLIKSAGYLGLFGITFAESGLLIGFFLPGDSLLFTSGFLASQGFLDLRILLPLLFVGAVAGDSAGYAFGRRFGPKVFSREDSLFFHKDHILRAQAFFEKHGGKSIILARFMPVIRTFAPILAGVGNMHYRTFLFYNIVGGLLWAPGLLSLGYFLGRVIPDAEKYILPIVLLIVFISVAPQAFHILRDQKMRRQLFSLLLRPFRRRT